MKQHQLDIEEKLSRDLWKWLSIHDALCKLTQSELYSLLLPIIEDKADAKKPANLLQENKDNRFISPSAISQKDFLTFDNICLDTIWSSYSSVDLSPVAVLWSNKITWTSQNKILSSIRWLELVWDWCIQLAYLHSSKKNANQDADYITSHRVLRNQNFGDSEYTNHFRILCMWSHIKSWDILKHIDKMVEHSENIVKMLNELKNHWIIDFDSISIEFWNLSKLNYSCDDTRHKLVNSLQESKKWLRQNVVSSVNQQYSLWDLSSLNSFDSGKLNYSIEHSGLASMPWVKIWFNENRIVWLWHYDSYCFSVFLHKWNKKVSVADWGITNWTWKLLSNWKSAFVVSWLWSEILLKLFNFNH